MILRITTSCVTDLKVEREYDKVLCETILSIFKLCVNCSKFFYIRYLDSGKFFGNFTSLRTVVENHLISSDKYLGPLSRIGIGNCL